MSEQARFFVLKRQLDSIKREKWGLIVLLWIIVFISQFYLDLGAFYGYLYGFIIGATLASGIWLYFSKREQAILYQIAQLNLQ
jgi:hypothetical protein